jgi:hypothetical protein
MKFHQRGLFQAKKSRLRTFWLKYDQNYGMNLNNIPNYPWEAPALANCILG